MRRKAIEHIVDAGFVGKVLRRRTEAFDETLAPLTRPSRDVAPSVRPSAKRSFGRAVSGPVVTPTCIS